MAIRILACNQHATPSLLNAQNPRLDN